MIVLPETVYVKKKTMSGKTSELTELVTLAQELSPLDKVRLVEQIMATLEQDLQPEVKPRRSLLGMW
jgi:hypothetical protein